MPQETTSTGTATLTAVITHADGTIEDLGAVWSAQTAPRPVPGVVGAYYQAVDLARTGLAMLRLGHRADGYVLGALLIGWYLAEVRQGSRVTAYLTPHPRRLERRVPTACYYRLRRAGAIVPQPGWQPEYYQSGETVTYYTLAQGDAGHADPE